MKCLICKAEINNEVEQFGDTKNPICQSDYLAGFSWIYDDAEVVNNLLQGMDIHSAVQVANEKSNSELQTEFLEIMHEISMEITCHSSLPA